MPTTMRCRHFIPLTRRANFCGIDLLRPGDLVLLKGTHRQDHLVDVIDQRRRRVKYRILIRTAIRAVTRKRKT